MFFLYNIFKEFLPSFLKYIFFIIFLYIYSILMLNRGHYPYKWLWNYAGDKFLKPKAHKNFHRCRPTTYYYFYDATLLSGVPDSDGLVSIALQGYVQTRSGTRVSTMQAWIESAVWTPVPGGLASDAGFKHNMQRFEDANDSWTQFVTFGSVGMNNHGRATQRNTRKVGCHKSILIFCFSKSHVFVPPCLHHFVRSSS